MQVVLRLFAVWLATMAVCCMEAVTAFDIGKEYFTKMRVDDAIVGVHSSEAKQVTPPSTIVSSWYAAMQKGKPSSGNGIGHGCPADSTLCGVVRLDTADEAIQLLSVREEDGKYAYDEQRGLRAEWSGVAYGDLTLTVVLDFTCVDSAEDRLEWVNHTSAFIDGDVHLAWSNKQFCSKDGRSGGDGGGDGGKDPQDSGLGLFGMFFLIGAVAFAGYLVAQAWFNTSTMGNSSDFFNELVDIVVDSISSIPRLVLEVVNKITGGGAAGNASRGGYSAV